MPKKLDRERDFGVICGGSAARFEQDGLMFDAHDNLIGDDPEDGASGTDAGSGDQAASQDATDKKTKGKAAGQQQDTTLIDDQLAAQAKGL